MCSYHTSGASVRPLELGALPTAVPCARLHVRHLVWEWGLVPTGVALIGLGISLWRDQRKTAAITADGLTPAGALS